MVRRLYLRPMIRELLDRRVPQFVALYVVGGWGFIQFVDWAVEPPPYF
ncbi:MAG: hypothetical protein ACR2GQ_02365 [Gemmatimonadota bacterium]